MITSEILIESIVPEAVENFSDNGFQGPITHVDPSFPTRGGPKGGMP